MERKGGKPPTLGKTVDEVMDAFEAASVEWCGIRIVEAVVVAGPVYRCDGAGGLSVVVDEVCARDATRGEIADLRRQVALGHVQIHAKLRRQFKVVDYIVLHQATGRALDPRSHEARMWERRLSMLDWACESRRGDSARSLA